MQDPEPFGLAAAPLAVVVNEVTKNLATVSDTDEQLHLWLDREINSYLGPDSQLPPANIESTATLSWYYEHGGRTYFASAIPNNTVTGVLREHALRLNSSVSCSPISRRDYPTTCVGDHPFVTTFETSRRLGVRVCAPGDLTRSPWTLSRDRQDIAEEVFIDMFVPSESSLQSYGPDFAIHCSATTTRGYFELGNVRNNFIPGPLMERWPSPDEMRSEFNVSLLPR